MGKVVEMVNLKCGCQVCGKIWIDHSEMVKDEDIESDLDYDQFVYFHKCNNKKEKEKENDGFSPFDY